MDTDQKLNFTIKAINLALNSDDKQKANSILMDVLDLIGGHKEIKLDKLKLNKKELKEIKQSFSMSVGFPL